MDFGIAGVAAITVICYLAGQLVKASGLDNKWIPIICGVVGGILGVLAMRYMPGYPAGDYITGSGRHRQRLRGHGHKRGCQADQAVRQEKSS